MVCITGAVRMHEGVPVFDREACIACGHCGAFCPENCFDLEPLPLEAVSPEELRALMKGRRSVRRFSGTELTPETLRELLSVLGNSPTGVNAQGVTVVAYGRRAIEEDILASVRRTLRLLRPTGIPALLGLISGRSGYIKALADSSDVIFHGAQLALYFYVPRWNPTRKDDGVIAAASVMYHAVSMGLGTLWNGVAERIAFMSGHSFRRNRPRGKRLTAVLCVGYPVDMPKWSVPDREWSLEVAD